MICYEYIKLGVTKVFVKDTVFHRLEGERNRLFAESATKLQTIWRGYNERMTFWLIRESSKLMQYWVREYLHAADPSEEVKECVKTLETGNEKECVEAIQHLEELGVREKNVEIITDLGGVKAILTAVDKYPKHQKLNIASTRALSKFSDSEENATRVARGGAVKQMVCFYFCIFFFIFFCIQKKSKNKYKK